MLFMAVIKGWEEGGTREAGEADSYRAGNETGAIPMVDRKKSGNMRERRVRPSPRPQRVLGRKIELCVLDLESLRSSGWL